MNRVTLHEVKIPLPADAPASIQMSVSQAEAAIRENNAMIEDILNTLLKDKENGYGE